MKQLNNALFKVEFLWKFLQDDAWRPFFFFLKALDTGIFFVFSMLSDGATFFRATFLRFSIFAVKVGVHNLSVGVVPFCHSEPTSVNDAQIAQTNRARPLEYAKTYQFRTQIIENAPSNEKI